MEEVLWSTASDAFQLLERFPSLAQIWETCVFAVNQEYVDQEGEPPVLKEGDEVAIIPPISGG